jgi:hypothetical protein
MFLMKKIIKWKYYIIIIASICVILFFSFKSFGKKFPYKGTSDIEEMKLIIKNKKISNEEECREIFEKIFNTTFKKIRPEFLTNPETGKRLELDGFNEKIITPIGKGLAFEYHGAQHYYFTPHFHKNDFSEFEKQQKLDKLKEEICKMKKILLIVIPYKYSTYEDKEFFIKKQICHLGMSYYLN